MKSCCGPVDPPYHLPLCIPLRGNIPLGGNNLLSVCSRDSGRKKLLKTINL